MEAPGAPLAGDEQPQCVSRSNENRRARNLRHARPEAAAATIPNATGCCQSICPKIIHACIPAIASFINRVAIVALRRALFCQQRSQRDRFYRVSVAQNPFANGRGWDILWTMKVRWILLCAALAFALNAPAGVLARFRMNNLGVIDVELFEQDKPVTVSNFVAYVKSGVWHDDIMHRWVQDFVIQGGSYTVPHLDTGFSSLAVNPTTITTFPAITNEYSVGKTYSNVYGTIAMARVSGQTNSATSSWYFNVNNNTSLDSVDGGFTVFGRTLRGTNVLNLFKQPAGSTNIYFYSSGSSVPVYSTDGHNGFWLNVDITLLTAQIAKVAGGLEISWNGVEGKTNIVDFSKVSPPVWQPLQSIAGVTGRMAITNNPGSDAFRMYRVRVDFTN